jgi:hypothetical protein
VKIILLEEARRQLEVEDVWWREHRDARELLIQEFEQALVHLRAAPESGQPYRRARGRQIYRWLMEKTGYHVYYFVDRERRRLEIHSLWGARRRRGPRL